jgi:hypothetical protein
MGFDPMPLVNNFFPRDVLTVARKNQQLPKPVYEKDDRIYKSIRQIQNMAERLSELPSYPGMGILGTTIEAAFAKHCLGDRVAFFIDENPHKIGLSFHGKDVRHPETITDDEVVVIPMGISSEAIRKRFSGRYHGHYVCV